MPLIKIQFSLLFFMLLAIGCRSNIKNDSENPNSSDNNILINGVLEHGAGEYIYLDEMNAREFIPIDTVICDEKGEFNIPFRSEYAAFYALKSMDKGYVTLLLEPGEKVEFKGDNNSFHSYSVTGSPGSELINMLSVEHKKTVTALAEISKKNRASMKLPGYQEVKLKLDEEFDSLATAFYNYSVQFIYENPQSLSILIALYNQYGYGLPVFNPDADINLFQFVDSSLSIHYPNNDAVKMLHSQIETSGRKDDNALQTSGPKLGEKAPDFVMNDYEGNPIALIDFRGNYLLLSFWAAWSKPSREENEYLKKAFQMFGDKGFTIFQISIDDNERLWKQTIESDKLDWHHASDLRRWESEINDLYSLEKIPSNYLISPDGNVAGIDLFGEELIETLRKKIN